MTPSRGRAVGGYAELAFHALAHVPSGGGASPLASAASLHSPAYVAWSAARGGSPRAICEDALVLSALLQDGSVAASASLLATLHGSIDAFLESAARALGEVSASEVAEPSALEHLRALGSPAVEILRAGMALGATIFAPFYRDHSLPRILAVAEHIARAPIAASGPAWLSGDDWELSLALGIHGRALGSRVIVGAGHPEEPLEEAAARAHALICHERAVVRSSTVLTRRGLSTEWAWVESLSVSLERALVQRQILPRSHEAWLNTLSLAGLADLPRELGDELTREAVDGPT